MSEDKTYLLLKGDTNYWLKHLQLLNVGRVARLLSKKDKEIERLNNIINEYEKMSFVHEIDLQNRINEAIEYIKQNCDIEKNYYPYIDTRNIDVKYLLDILKGSDKE